MASGRPYANEQARSQTQFFWGKRILGDKEHIWGYLLTLHYIAK